MKQFIGAAAALLYTTVSSSNSCGDSAVNDGGNWYCNKVDAITYNGVGMDSSYKKITKMDGDSGSCESSPFGYSGSMSPLDEEVSASVYRYSRACDAPDVHGADNPSRSPSTSVVPLS